MRNQETTSIPISSRIEIEEIQDFVSWIMDEAMETAKEMHLGFEISYRRFLNWTIKLGTSELKLKKERKLEDSISKDLSSLKTQELSEDSNDSDSFTDSTGGLTLNEEEEPLTKPKNTALKRIPESCLFSLSELNQDKEDDGTSSTLKIKSKRTIFSSQKL